MLVPAHTKIALYYVGSTMPTTLTTLLLKLPRNTEVTPESAQTFLAALTQINTVSNLQKLLGKKARSLALEVCLSNQQIKFMITCDKSLVQFIETQLQSNYPLVIIEKTVDPIADQQLGVSALSLQKGSYFPLQTYSAFKEIDPMSSLLSVISKSDPGQVTLIQYALEATDGSWQSAGQHYADTGGGKKVSGDPPQTTYLPHPSASVIKEKISFPGFKTSIRVASNTKDTLRELTSAFGVFTRSDGNSLGRKKTMLLAIGGNEIKALYERQVTDTQVLNIVELATLWHLPDAKIKTTSIVWGTKVLSEPPDNLPVAQNATEEEKQDRNFFAKTLFKNHESIFGLKTVDRRRHMWIVGKTGTGKSTLIANMAIDDLKKGRGVGVIDPHGDLCETILDYIPKDRINETIYFNPADRDFPVVINPLEVTNREEAELVVSGIVSIFNKIFGFSWGPRLEYILRNTLLTLSAIPDTTLEDVLVALTNATYRKRMIEQINDPVLKNFWVNEFAKMPDKQREEAISPILNKVGQFVTSPLIRRIIGQPKSSIALDQIMNDGKIILANLSQGRLGEDNAALLGAMIITKFQLAAMRRVDMPEDQRRDFFLYVDEFQNFATPSFMKILSEARKYRLCLTLANQYMAQIPEEVQKSILGNAGSIIVFSVGADDADVVYKEYAEVFTQNDLVNLSNRQIAAKLMIDGHSTRPFLAHTLPLPASRNQNRGKVIEISRKRWATKTSPVKVIPIEPIHVAPQQPPAPQQQQQHPPQVHQSPPRTSGDQYHGGRRPPYNRGGRPYPNRPRPPQQHQPASPAGGAPRPVEPPRTVFETPKPPESPKQ
jgi:hypothetical protein